MLSWLQFEGYVFVKTRVLKSRVIYYSGMGCEKIQDHKGGQNVQNSVHMVYGCSLLGNEDYLGGKKIHMD